MSRFAPLEMFKCGHCNSLKPFERGVENTYCGDCRDYSRTCVFVCGRCEEGEIHRDVPRGDELCDACEKEVA